MTGDDEAKEEALVLEHDLPPNRNTRSTKPNEVQAYSIKRIPLMGSSCPRNLLGKDPMSLVPCYRFPFS